MSRLSVTRADVAACWRNTARLQDAAGKTEDARFSRDTAKRVTAVNAWVRNQNAKQHVTWIRNWG